MGGSAEPPPPLAAADDGFDFPELDAVLTERAAEDAHGSDTGTDLPAGITADASALGDSAWTNEPPPPLPDDDEPMLPAADIGSVLDDRTRFGAETQRLAPAREWQSLAALTSAALDHSPWARQPETRVALLADLARLYRDRLGDAPSAEDSFRRLVELAPADPEPNRFLAQR